MIKHWVGIDKDIFQREACLLGYTHQPYFLSECEQDLYK